MEYSRTRDVLQPTRGTAKSAGIDFYVPAFTETFKNDLFKKNDHLHRLYMNSANIRELIDEKNIIPLYPKDRILIPSGIKVKIPKDHVLIGFNKSGVSSKKGLDILACVVDEDYQGEIHISIVNTGNDTITIEPQEKIIQWILLPVNYSKPEEVKLEELYSEETERGAGGFGSTDKPIGTELR
jgi:dUTP pyrophosphatase